MTTIIALHSYRGGTGKTTLAANAAVVLAARGHRVGLVDTDVQSPGAHVLFGLDLENTDRCLGHYLTNECRIEEAARDLTDRVLPDGGDGALLLLPSNVRPDRIMDVVGRRYDVALLHEGFQNLVAAHDLDVLLLDTHPGLSEETVVALALSDTVAVVTRPDAQEYHGARISSAVARTMNCPRVSVVVNLLDGSDDADEVRARMREACGAEVVAVLPHDADVAAMASAGVLALQDPDHPMVRRVGRLADDLLGV